MEQTYTSIGALHDALTSGETSARMVADAYLGRIAERNPALGAFLTITQDEALEQAAESDARIARGEPLRPLEGVPVAVKDNIVMAGVRTTCGSKILENYVPPYTATVVERLRAAGAVVVGKTNCDEFAMGSSN